MKKIFTLFCIISFFDTQAQIGGGWDWAFNTGSLGGTIFKHLKYTSDGSEILMGGQALAAAYFGSTTLTAPPQSGFPGNIKIFGKINSVTGAQTIIRSFVNIPINFDCITTDDVGNFYVGGANVGTTDFDFGNGVIVPGSTFKMGLIAKFDPAGNTIWAKTFQMGATGSSNNQILKLAVANSGNIYFWGFNPNSTTAAPPLNRNSPLYKLDNTGNIIWFKDALNGSNIVGSINKSVFLADKFIDADENVHLFLSTNSASGYTFDGVPHPGGSSTYGSSTLISLNASGLITNAQTFEGGVSNFQVNKINGNLIFGWNQFNPNPGAFLNLQHPLASLNPFYANAFEGMMETDKFLNFIKSKDYSTTLDNPFFASLNNDKFLALPNGKMLIAKNFDKTAAYYAGVNAGYQPDATKYASAIVETDVNWNIEKFITGGKAAFTNQTFIAAYNNTYLLGAGFYAEQPGFATANPPLPTTSFGSVNLTGFNAAPDFTTAYGTYSTTSSFRYDVAIAQTKSLNFPTIPFTTWLGITNNWNTAGNWSNGVPTNSMKALFNSPTSFYPTVFTSPTAATLEINTGVTIPLPTTLALVGGVKNDGTIVLNNTGVFQGLGSKEWKGSGSVNFTGTAASFSYANAFTNSLILNANVITSYNLNVPSVTFNSGKLNLNSKKITITAASPTAVSGTGPTSYFYGGTLERKINSSGSYEFPVGNFTDFQSATINTNNLIGVNSVATTFNSGAITGTTPSIIYNAATISNALNGGWYSINPNQQPTGGNYNVTLKIKGSSNSVPSAGNYTVIKRNSSATAWAVQGSYSLATINAGIITVTNNGLTSFSDFAVGIGNAVLPVGLTQFNAKENVSNVLLAWSSSFELNNKGYNIQHSTNGIAFTNIGFVNGKGNSTTNTDYNFTHYKPSFGKNYYRLEAVDFDDKTTLSKVEIVDVKNVKNSIRIYPNPTSKIININSSGKISSLELLDITGRKIKSYSGSQSNVDVSMLTNGIYILKVILASGEKVEEKIMVRK